MPFPELKNPPIVESIIILRFKDEVDEKHIEEFCDSSFVKSTYDAKRPNTRPSGVHNNKQYGYTLKSNDNDKVLRLNLDSLSFHRLSYAPFETFYNEFEEIVEVFRDNIKLHSPEKDFVIDLITLRYLNVIKVQFDEYGVFDTSDYTTLYIESSLVLDNSFLQVNVTNKGDNDIHGIVIQALKSNNEGTSIEGIIVDIQVFRSLEVPYDKGQIKDNFGKLREYKNSLFFEIIHPDVIKTYQ